MKVDNLQLKFRADRAAIVQGTEDATVRVWCSLEPVAGRGAFQAPTTVVVLLDCSGTMRRFEIPKEETQRWVEVARQRSEVQVVESDRHTVYQLQGQTLQDMRGAAQSPLSIAAAALQKATADLRDNDVCCLVGFATSASVLFDGRRPKRSRTLQSVLENLQRNPSSVGLGNDTRMAEGARLAASLLKSDPTAKRTRRLVVITDGIVHDQVESIQQLEEIRSEGIAVTTVGLGPEFDEEFLTRIADWTGGSYHYAPKPDDLESRLQEDFGTFHTVAGRELTVSARGLEGAVVMSVTQLTPQMRMFEEIRLRGDWFQVDVGDISGAAGVSLMAEFSLPWMMVGRHSIGELQFEWRNPETDKAQEADYVVQVECLPATAPDPAIDRETDEMFTRLQVYRAERAAQWAQEGGRPGLSTVRLREASQILNRLGERELAERFGRQAEDIEAEDVNPDRTKTMKDWVRRLGRQRNDETETE